MPESTERGSEKREFTHTLSQVADFLVPKIRRPGEGLRAVIDKVRKRVEYAAKNGDLEAQVIAGKRLYCLPLVLAWASRKWPANFPGVTTRQEGTASGAMGFTGGGSGFTYPGDLKESHAALRVAHMRIYELTEALKSAQLEIDRLRPLAEKYEEICEKNRKSAKRSRSGRS